jgi:hypothetical protein
MKEVYPTSSVITGQCLEQITQKRNDSPLKFYYDNLF